MGNYRVTYDNGFWADEYASCIADARAIGERVAARFGAKVASVFKVTR